LTVDVTAQHFSVQGNKVVAEGPVVATVERPDGSTETVTQNVDLKVSPTNKCQVLDLHLAELYVNLLGLEVRTSDINVKITGESDQALGKLFCSLSKGLKLDKKALAKRTARSLNKALADRPLPILSLTSKLREPDQPAPSGRAARSGGRAVPPPAPGSCEVLDLLLGPLHLDLLGLVVDLYGPTTQDPVEVLVTADPNGGVLGSTFCQYAGPYEG
jgi:hypothetical protein